MPLYAFMLERRSELLDECIRQLRALPLPLPQINAEAEVATFFDEVVWALEAGVAHDDSAAERSRTAARVGANGQLAGCPPDLIPKIFGSISQAVGTVAHRHDWRIEPDEYVVFNRCLDDAVAKSIETYWQLDRAAGQERLTERFGFVVHELRNSLGSAAMAFARIKKGEVAVAGKTADLVDRSLTRMQALLRGLESVQSEAAGPPESPEGAPGRRVP
jgi:hypothetical protein